MRLIYLVLCCCWSLLAIGPEAVIADDAAAKVGKRVLLIGQAPDGHPVATHEYRAGTQLLAKFLSRVEGVQTIVVSADGDWSEGPALLDGADAAVVFVSQGAKWVQSRPERLSAFQALAKRGGGLVCLHWGMGTKDADDIPAFVELFGGCHGGPDRKYKVLEARTQLAAAGHPILRGVEPVLVQEEFYYQLKWPQSRERHLPLLTVPIDGQSQTVAWCWERPAGGRSFGFSGLHFHANWQPVANRRMLAQAVLWTLGRDVPSAGLDVTVTADDLKLPPHEPAKQP